MRAVLLGRDLLIGSRIAAAAQAAGGDLDRIDHPRELPPAASVDLLLVDWSEREPDWGEAIHGWRRSAPDDGPRVMLFGPHVDLDAQRAAREAGLGPMMARSRLVTSLPDLIPGRRPDRS